MGLLTILKKVKQKEQELRILILGLDNAGKTTVMKKVSGEDISQISPTVGFNIKTLDYKGYVLNLWDVGGQKSIRTYWRNYFEQTDGVVWVVDSVDRSRLEECRLQLRDILCQEKLAGASLLIFANKQDLGGALSFDQIAEILDLHNADISGRHWTIIGCSAFTGEGLIAGFDWLVDDIASRILLMS
jgi:ADP-ribosylation factor-like protein 2